MRRTVGKGTSPVGLGEWREVRRLSDLGTYTTRRRTLDNGVRRVPTVGEERTMLIGRVL